MFATISQLKYDGERNGEHHWIQSGAGSEPEVYLAATLLGTQITRVRCIRVAPGQQLDERRYHLADGGEGTLPYHSWIVAKGDEQWSRMADAVQARSLLAPYIEGFAYSESSLRLTLPLASDERIYGLGERTGSMNKRGLSFPLWNVDPPKWGDAELESMYTSIPFYVSIDQSTGTARGVLVDHTGRIEMDFGKTNETETQITVQGDSLVVYFFAGPTPADVMRQYTDLTGRMLLPPLWALGHHQCRWSYASAEKVQDIAQRLRAGKHPSDAIWLDIDYMRGYRDFTWNTETFPNPALMIQTLHEQGFHLVTILDPGIKIDDEYQVYQEGIQQEMFCRYPDGRLFKGSVWPGLCVFPDFSQRRVREWWGNQCKVLLEQGVDGLWNDMNEPALTSFLEQDEAAEKVPQGATMDGRVLHQAGGGDVTNVDGPPVLHAFFHNAYGMQMARGTQEGLLRLRPNQRPFVLTRSGTAGMQRYAALWTGDNGSEWEHILLALKMILNVGMSGVAFVGADIGGFWGDCNGELLVRFAQLGALMPFCRNHNSLYAVDQEPWVFGEPYESAYRAAIETRYRLLPYLYTLFYEASVNGSPILRPLYFHYPHDEQACDLDSEFLVGDALLSAPITEAGATSWSVYLPQGQWFDFWDGTEYSGQTEIELATPLERWPLLVKGNSIIPTAPVVQYIDQQKTMPITFTCYMATDGLANYTLYEDDGSTLDYRNGVYATTSVSCRADAGGVVVRIDEDHKGYQPRHDGYELVVHVGNRTFQRSIKAGQGSVTVHLG